MEDEA
jgi:hypothetical protein